MTNHHRIEPVLEPENQRKVEIVALESAEKYVDLYGTYDGAPKITDETLENGDILFQSIDPKTKEVLGEIIIEKRFVIEYGNNILEPTTA